MDCRPVRTHRGTRGRVYRGDSICNQIDPHPSRGRTEVRHRLSRAPSGRNSRELRPVVSPGRNSICNQIDPHPSRGRTKVRHRLSRAPSGRNSRELRPVVSLGRDSICNQIDPHPEQPYPSKRVTPPDGSKKSLINHTRRRG